MRAYSRPGLSFISFCADAGFTEDVNVRKALALCMDKVSLTEEYLGVFGTPVNGFYGIGQWMFQMANGSMVPEEGQEEEWADLKIDMIPEIMLNTEEADALLNEAGWHLTQNATVYEMRSGETRCKLIDGKIVPLELKLIYPEGNGVGPMLDEVFIPYLSEAGIELQTEAMPMPELLKKYYRQEERDCDLILLGTNFGDVYDPTGEYDDNGTSYLTGITDPELLELAISMRSTEPGNATEFCRRWLAYQAKLAEDAAVLPLYSDAYLDFHISALQQYEPGKSGNWATAVTTAILSDYVPEEEETEEENGDDFELEGDENLDLEELE
jgi:ABC-type transport system substrate-binding protein